MEPKQVPSLDTLTERIDGVRETVRLHETHNAARHELVLDELRGLRSSGEARGDRVLEAMQAQSRLVIQAAGVIVALLIVGLLGVVGVGLDLDVPGIGSVGVSEARAAAPVEPAVSVMTDPTVDPQD